MAAQLGGGAALVGVWPSEIWRRIFSSAFQNAGALSTSPSLAKVAAIIAAQLSALGLATP